MVVINSSIYIDDVDSALTDTFVGIGCKGHLPRQGKKKNSANEREYSGAHKSSCKWSSATIGKQLNPSIISCLVCRKLLCRHIPYHCL